MEINPNPAPIQPQTITIDCLPDGRVSADWWTPDTGDILCGLCGKCGGWRSKDKDRTCAAGNQWCG